MRMPPIHITIRVIQEEHDCLSAVIRAMQKIAREMKNGRKAPDLRVFRAMLLYISDYPEQVHHPKEDRYLFSLMRRRAGNVNDTLDELESQHGQGEALVRQLEHALNRYELQGDIALPHFVELVDRYAAFYLEHMRLEEQIILPASVQVLTDDDWKVVNAAFALNQNPLAARQHDKAFDRLFSLIVNITPAPIGLGPVMTMQ